MKIYLAGERQAAGPDPNTVPLWLRDGRVKRRLFSYFYHNQAGNAPDHDILTSSRMGLDLFLDSGAFTAFTKKAIIEPRNYAQFIKNSSGIWTTCSSLDAIGRGEEAAKASYDNLKTLESLGVGIQPVFHVREPDEWLARYIEEGYDYIFIGGMVPETTEWLFERLDVLWDSILTNYNGTAKVKVHGFGLTDQKLMFRYPWYSVDSSSWLMTGIYGACVFRAGMGDRLRKVVFSEESPEARKYNGWHYNNLPGEMKSQVDKWLEPYGVTAKECGQHYSFRDAVNAAVFQSLEDLATDTFEGAQQTLFT